MLFLAAIPLAFITSPAEAQDISESTGAEPSATPQPSGGPAQTYTPADFARFSPNTALDMLRQVPGFTIERPDTQRGLGQASGNVLINSQRTSGKSNDAVTELGRISAADVVRIEILDGATLDVPGLTGQVANVVVRVGGLSGTFAYRPQVRARRLPARLTEGEASLNGELLDTRFTVAVENNAFTQGNNGPEIVTGPTGGLLESRAEDLRIIGNTPRLSVNLKRGSAGGGPLANLNGTLSADRARVGELSLQSPIGRPGRTRRLAEVRRSTDYEVGGDYEFGVLGGRLKLIGLRKGGEQTFSQAVTFDAAGGRTGDRFIQDQTEAETVARGEFRWTAGGADWQLAGEGALNSLAVESGLASLDTAGAFQPVGLPAGQGTVRERRGEVTASYGRPLVKGLTLQLSGGAELSRLSQSGTGGLTRQFLRPKGSANLAWTASPRLDVSLRLERVVGQLNFGDFVASTNLSSETENAGNPDLVPPQTWVVEGRATRRFGALGQATLRLYHRRITDIVDVVPIGLTGQAPGNLPLATVSGLEFTGTLTPDAWGIRGIKVDANAQLQTSRLDDPVTGLPRPISDDLRSFVEINARRDQPGTDWAYGGGYNAFVPRPDLRLDVFTRRINRGGEAYVFVENKDVLGLVVRGTAGNLLGTNEILQRTFFDGRRTGPVLFTERRVRQFGPVFTLEVSGRF